jgi:hypothetical protein
MNTAEKKRTTNPATHFAGHDICRDALAMGAPQLSQMELPDDWNAAHFGHHFSPSDSSGSTRSGDRSVVRFVFKDISSGR